MSRRRRDAVSVESVGGIDQSEARQPGVGKWRQRGHDFQQPADEWERQTAYRYVLDVAKVSRNDRWRHTVKKDVEKGVKTPFCSVIYA